MSLQDVLNRDRRLRMLLLLHASNGYQAAAALLYDVLPDFGHAVSMEVVAADIGWLMDEGLVTPDAEIGGGLVALTQKGIDVATGRQYHCGIARPRPRS